MQCKTLPKQPVISMTAFVDRRIKRTRFRKARVRAYVRRPSRVNRSIIR